MPSADPYDLARFLAAQDDGGTYDRAIGELRRGRKTSHWVWFVLPQLAGLGLSATSRRYAISSLAEARAYLAHPVLGSRLLACAGVLAEIEGSSADAVVGSVDAQKLRSCMTLFLHADPAEAVFGQVLDAFFDGVPDEATDRLLAG